MMLWLSYSMKSTIWVVFHLLTVPLCHCLIFVYIQRIMIDALKSHIKMHFPINQQWLRLLLVILLSIQSILQLASIWMGLSIVSVKIHFVMNSVWQSKAMSLTLWRISLGFASLFKIFVSLKLSFLSGILWRLIWTSSATCHRLKCERNYFLLWNRGSCLLALTLSKHMVNVQNLVRMASQRKLRLKKVYMFHR